tara:strand:+ start:180 stop:875 length:696 start_codon:yes stop_codon:yes gene_type:complete
MGYSFYEIYTTSQRAFRGMGFPFGADEDAAYIVAWLELNKLKGVDIFKNNIEQIDQQYDGVLSLKEMNKGIDFKNKSILMKGSGLIDFLQSNIYQNNKISINIENCSNGILFLPLLHKANKNIGYLELIFKDFNKKANIFKIYDNKIFYNIEENIINESEVRITLSNKDLSETNNTYKEIINEKIIQENLSNSLTPNENNWNKISMIANRTFVPESEESRNKGAGGGDAND